MSDQTDERPDPREELRRIDEDLVGLRRRIAELNSEVGDRSDGAGDAGDAGALLTERDEQQALIDILEQRRERIADTVEGS